MSPMSQNAASDFEELANALGIPAPEYFEERSRDLFGTGLSMDVLNSHWIASLQAAIGQTSNLQEIRNHLVNAMAAVNLQHRTGGKNVVPGYRIGKKWYPAQGSSGQ